MERLCNIPIYQRVTMQVLLKYREKAIRRRQKIKIFGLSIRKQKEVAFLYKNIRKLETCLFMQKPLLVVLLFQVLVGVLYSLSLTFCSLFSAPSFLGFRNLNTW